jgi:non-heme chloroperoxidase
MPYVTSKDGTEILDKDRGRGQSVVVGHGWPLSADASGGQMLYFLQHGYRAVARSTRTQTLCP